MNPTGGIVDQTDRRKVDVSLWERDADADETLVPLAEQQEAIETREDFFRFVEALCDDCDSSAKCGTL
jgi:hypothetical protein